MFCAGCKFAYAMQHTLNFHQNTAARDCVMSAFGKVSFHLGDKNEAHGLNVSRPRLNSLRNDRLLHQAVIAQHDQ